MIRPSLDYTDRDFDALRARAEQLISAAFPEWDTETVADMGMILVDFFCFIGDVNGFYQNAQARETRWSQARQRKNILSLVKMIGYEVTGATAATAQQSFTLTTPAVADVRLEAGRIVSTLEQKNPTRYQLLEDLVIPAGVTSAIATVENSEFESNAFASLGTSNQAFTLTRTPYLPGSLRVNAGDGTYTQVRNFLNSRTTDRHYTIVVDDNRRARVTFGNGILGAIPSGTIRMTYKTGGGAAGRVEAAALRKLERGVVDVLGNIVNVTTTNVLRSEGGYDGQPIASIRQLAPESVRVSDRTVAREDYEAVAKMRNDLVSRALMLTRVQSDAIQPNSGTLFLVPPGAGDLPDSTIQVVRDLFVLRPHAPSFRLEIMGATYLVVNVFARIYLAKGAASAIVKAAIVKALGMFFEDRISDATSEDYGADNLAIDFGWKDQDAQGVPTGTFQWAAVHNVVRDTAGVRSIDPTETGFLLNGKRENLPIGPWQFPKLGTITLIDGDTGLPL